MKRYRIKELGDIVTGNTPSKKNLDYYNSEDIPFFKPDSLDENEVAYLTTAKEYLSSNAKSVARIVPRETVLFSCIGSIGKIGITNVDNSSFNQQINAIIPNKEIILPKYLCYALKYNKKKIQAIANAAVVPIINKTQFSEFEISIHQKEEQVKVVNILDQAQELIDKRKAQIKALDELIQSVFYDMFGDVNSNDKNWDKIEVEKTCKTILGGGTPSTKNKEYFIGDIPWVTPKDMKSLRIRESIININQEAIQNSSAKLIPQGSVLMVIRSGILKRMLPVAINDCEVAVNQDMKAFIPNGEIINAIYLLFYFKSIQGILLSRVRSVTADNLEFNTIKKHLIAIPPIELQNQFAEMVENIEKQKELLNESLVELENNFNSLMQRAFNGELF